MSCRIFISYRRDDSIGTSGRLYDRMVQAFGRDNVFMDVDHIPAGVDFVRHLNSQVAACNVFLAVIGPNWLAAADAAGNRRLDNPNDFVRLELQAALARDVRVIPVLIDGARMPKPDELPESLRSLSYRQAVDMRNVQFGSDADRLIGKIGGAGWRVRSGWSMRSLTQQPVAAAGAAAVLLLAGSVAIAQLPPEWLPWKREEVRRIAAEKAKQEKDFENKRKADAEKARQDAESKRVADALAEARKREEERPLSMYEIRIRNKSGVPISALHYSKCNDPDWHENRLHPNEQIPREGTKILDMRDGAPDCCRDMLALLGSGATRREKRGVIVCRASESEWIVR